MTLMISDLKEITEQYSRVVLYGAGETGRRTLEILRVNGICPDYFLVTRMNHGEPAYLDGIPVYAMKDKVSDIQDDRTLILLTVNDSNENVIQGVLRYYDVDTYLPISVFYREWLYDTPYGRLVRELNRRTDISQTGAITLLNTQTGTDNLGDDIIMKYARCALSPLVEGHTFYEVATHLPPSMEDIQHMLSSKAVIACGTNFLKPCLENPKSTWIFHENMIHLNNFVLFAAGSGNFGEYSPYSKVVWNSLLHNGWIHSVRESATQEELLNKWNVRNVINTGCVTLFGGKADEICGNIPARKSDRVIITVTAENRDAELDLLLFSICEKLYKEVYFWPQGGNDLNWISSICDMRKIKVLEHTLSAYDEILAMDNIDYIGSRLHGGIYALTHGKRSLIVATDGRGTAFHRDTNLPIIYRNQVRDLLCERIKSEWKTEIYIDHRSIDQWFDFTRKKINS